MDPGWHEAMVNANIDIFEITYEESVSYFKRLENLEKIRRTNTPNHSSQPIDNKKYVIRSVRKSLTNSNATSMWCHYYEKKTITKRMILKG
jgi:hypothetical protein